MKIQSYEDMEVKIVRSTKDPAHLVKTCLTLTQSKKIKHLGPVSEKSLRFLQTARHGTPLEFASVVFSLEGISRSLLAQITRHRTSTFMSSSQHYSDYRDMPMVVHGDLVDNRFMYEGLKAAVEAYAEMVDNCDVPPEEARQVLPGACAVNLLWKIDLRNLANFFEMRVCKRNVTEMQILCRKVARKVGAYWPEYMNTCGPACYTDGKCNQGRMSCGSPFETYKENSND